MSGVLFLMKNGCSRQKILLSLQCGGVTHPNVPWRFQYKFIKNWETPEAAVSVATGKKFPEMIHIPFLDPPPLAKTNMIEIYFCNASSNANPDFRAMRFVRTGVSNLI